MQVNALVVRIVQHVKTAAVANTVKAVVAVVYVTQRKSKMASKSEDNKSGKNVIIFIAVVVIAWLCIRSCAGCGDDTNEVSTQETQTITPNPALSTTNNDVELPLYEFGKKEIRGNQYDIKVYLKSKPKDSIQLAALARNIANVTNENEVPQSAIWIYSNEPIAKSSTIKTGFVYTYFRNTDNHIERDNFDKDHFEYITALSNENTDYRRKNVESLNSKLRNNGITACDLVIEFNSIQKQSYKEADRLFEKGTQNNFDYQEKYLKQERLKLSKKYGLTEKDWDTYFFSEDYMCDVIFK